MKVVSLFGRQLSSLAGPTVQKKMGPLGTFLVASRKHSPQHSIHLYIYS